MSFLKQLFVSTIKKPLDELQLEAAQDRLIQRSADLDQETDELTKVIRRMKRKKYLIKGKK